MPRGIFATTLVIFASVLVVAGSGCSGTSASSPHATPGASSPPTRLAQPIAPLSVYIGSTDGSVSALDAASGAVRWRALIASSASTITVAALAESALYVTAANANASPLTTDLAMLRARDGAVLWHASFAGTAAVVATGQGMRDRNRFC
jgi:outer membrane protein assembly factor BamB